MKRLLLPLLLLAAALPARAQVFVYTNNVLALDPLAHPLVFQAGSPVLRYTVYPLSGTNALSTAGVTGQWTIVDLADGATVGTYTANVSTARIRFEGAVNARIREGGSYQGIGRMYSGTTMVAAIANDYIGVAGASCSTCSAASAVVIVVTTNLTTIYITNQLDNITSTIENFYTSGVSSVKGQTGAVDLVSGDGSIGITTTNGTVNVAVAPGVGVAQSPITNTVDYNSKSATNMDQLRAVSGFFSGSVNAGSITLGTGVTSIWALGRGIVVSNNASGLFLFGDAIGVGASARECFAAGTNLTIRASTFASICLGNNNKVGDVGTDYVNYMAVLGGAANDCQMSCGVIGGGTANTNFAVAVGPGFGVIGGGTHNANRNLYGQICGGHSNQNYGVSGTAFGNCAVTAAGTTNAFVINCDSSVLYTGTVSKALWINAPNGVRITSGTNVYLLGPTGPTFNGGNFP